MARHVLCHTNRLAEPVLREQTRPAPSEHAQLDERGVGGECGCMHTRSWWRGIDAQGGRGCGSPVSSCGFAAGPSGWTSRGVEGARDLSAPSFFKPCGSAHEARVLSSRGYVRRRLTVQAPVAVPGQAWFVFSQTCVGGLLERAGPPVAGLVEHMARSADACVQEHAASGARRSSACCALCTTKQDQDSMCRP